MLDETQKKYVAERTRHFLQRIRWKNRWTQADLAKNLGMNRTTVSAYENAHIERNKYIRACEILWELAELEGDYYENFNDFLIYLFQIRTQSSEGTSRWEAETLKALCNLSSWIRIRLSEDVLKEKDRERKEQMFRILLNVSQLSSENLQSLENITTTMAQSTAHKKDSAHAHRHP